MIMRSFLAVLILIVAACSGNEVKNEFYENGQLMESTMYKQGRVHGLYEAFYEDGQIRAKGSYEKGEKTGVWTDWYPNGNKMFEALYDSNGLVDLQAWDKKGNQTIKDCNGTAILLYPDGTPMSQVSYKDCLMDGEWKVWFEDGQVESEFYYDKGIPTGIWKFWNSDGTLQKAEKHDGGMVH